MTLATHCIVSCIIVVVIQLLSVDSKKIVRNMIFPTFMQKKLSILAKSNKCFSATDERI